MRFDEAYSGKVFIASRPDWEEADAILYGMPMDWTVSYRPGSRFGPARIREVSIKTSLKKSAEYHPAPNCFI